MKYSLQHEKNNLSITSILKLYEYSVFIVTLLYRCSNIQSYQLPPSQGSSNIHDDLHIPPLQFHHILWIHKMAKTRYKVIPFIRALKYSTFSHHRPILQGGILGGYGYPPLKLIVFIKGFIICQ